MLRTLAFLALTAVLYPQSYTGSISGRVTDATGSVVPGAAVVVTETNTNTVARTLTNDVGDYVVSFLNPGVYKVSVTREGFREQVQTALALQINQALRVDASLQMGAVSDKVEVTGTADLLNYTSPEIGHVVGKDQMLNLPLLAANNRGRSPLLFSKLLPGVTSTSANNSNINNFSFGGGRPVTNEILVDGLPTTNPSDQTYTLTPSPDAIQEFKVLTTPFSAEWGHTGGGVMILTSRGGTNNLHGYVYDYFRNRLLNARPVFGNASSLKYVQNNPGIAIGGPVVLPKIYDGRNRTFFFADFNVTLASNGNLYQQLVPTALQKAGDFSQTFASGSLVPIYDPAATAKLPNGSYSRPPFQDNRIPASRIDPIASRIAGFYPDPNGSFANGLNYSVAPPQLRQTWQSIVRVDQNIGDNDRMFVRFGRYNPNGDAQNRIPNKANNDTSGGFRDTQVAFSETHVFSARVVNDFRAGFVQEVNYTIPSGGPAPELGLAGVPLNEFPIIKVSQMIQLGSDPLSSDRNRSWVFSEALNVHLGRHTLKMGGDYRRQMYNFYEPGKLAGTYTFNPTFTSFPGKNGTGFGLADMLLGVPASTDFDGADYTYRMNINSAGMYLQDDFKIRSNLTLNLGLRWEYNGPYSEANGQFGSFLPNLVNRTTGNLGEVAFAGRDGQPSHFSPNIYRNFLPRIGFAWRALPKTVFRGGYGIYRLPSIGYGTTGPVSQYGVDQSFTSVDNNITPFYTFASGVPARSFNVDAEGRPNIPASLTRPTSNVTALETRDRTPYNQMWQFGIQRQVTDAWFIEVDYVGNKGTKLPVVLPWNQLRPGQFGSGSQQQGKRPYPQYLNVSALSNDGNSTYHSLQAKVEHLWRNGLQVQGSYTFSKLINDVDAPARANAAPIQNYYDLRGERGVGGYDIPQRLVANFVYEAPFGRHGRYLQLIPVVSNIIDGWQVAGIAEFQIGLPMQIRQSNNTGGFTGGQRPNQIASAALDRGERTLTRYFNTAAFTAAPQFTLGNAPRFPLHGPGINNWDLSLMRNFKFQERYNLQFIGQLFNAFNHPNYSAPNTTIGNQNYGRITGAQSSRVVEFALRFFF
ncbi:MAG: hypothetical protein IANPNBLG_00060 [Bryobacteraceae bacterium]|nr:hypothetical protein [Bryobacteraceae bacterium]